MSRDWSANSTLSPGCDSISRRVLYVNTPTYTGGAEISLLTLMHALDRERYRPLLVTSGEGQLAEEARRYGIPIAIQEFPWFRKRYPWRYPASILRLAFTLRRSRAALVHTNCDHCLRYVMRACQLCRLPYVSHVRDFVRAWFQPANLLALNRASAVVANSQAVATACIEAGVAPARVRVIYNPVDVALYQQAGDIDRRQIRIAFGLPADAFIVGIVGQIQASKGHGELLEAAPQVFAAIPNAHFAVVGEAFTAETRAFKDQLLRSATEGDFADRVHFLGFRRDVPTVMHALDVLAVPSWSESFGRVVVEGLAAGCPVISTNAGGIPEIISDGVTGLLITPQDPHVLAEAILRLATNPSLREQFRRIGPSRAQDFGVEQHVHQMQALYDDVRGRPS
jgi:glycosyltransferase involved in cell wall biosynthesis